MKFKCPSTDEQVQIEVEMVDSPDTTIEKRMSNTREHWVQIVEGGQETTSGVLESLGDRASSPDTITLGTGDSAPLGANPGDQWVELNGAPIGSWQDLHVAVLGLHRKLTEENADSFTAVFNRPSTAERVVIEYEVVD